MFIGEILCLAVFFIKQSQSQTPSSTQTQAAPHDETTPLLFDNEPHNTSSSASASDSTSLQKQDKPTLSGWKYFYLWLPTLCDLVATTLMNIGLLYINASIYQMVYIFI
jgi:hypothetical protein